MARKTALVRRAQALLAKNDLSGALAAYEEACRIGSDDPEMWLACGRLHARSGDPSRALARYRKGLELDPRRAEAHHDVAVALEGLGRPDEARGWYEAALELRPDMGETRYRLGRLHEQRGGFDAAGRHYEEAVRLRPDHARAHYRLANVCAIQSRTEEAARHYDRAHALDPDRAQARWNRCRLLPVVYDSEAEIDDARRRFADGLETLEQELRLDSRESRRQALRGLSASTNFYLQYQGRDDKALQVRYGRLVMRVARAGFPQWSERPHVPGTGDDGRLRIGLASAFLRAHNGAQWLLGWLRHIDRARFAVHCYHTGAATDGVTDALRAHAHVLRHIPGGIERAAQAIAADRLHALIYPELGMDGSTLTLAGLRLAPVQCVGWGHPITSGLPTMDYWLSSDLMEPEDGQDHYTESLVRLPHLAHVYSPEQRDRLLAAPPAKRRADFKLDDDRVLFLCTQSLFKYLPQYDRLFPAIAHRAPQARFVFVSISSRYVVNRFMQRIDRAFRQEGLRAQDYCRMLPRLTPDDYVELNRIADVFLDNPPWSGNNTAMTAMDCGLPIVALPTAYMRGRHAYGVLKRIGLDETIAATPEQYVETAARLGNDPDYRRHIRERIAACREPLYEDASCVRALEGVLEDAVGKAGAAGRQVDP
ncbi:MAG: tetratricopeptide repeat protein [Gammaproteobacteria bacterium]|nr:tetratricopeptide repeat protein [Gammaproteobacteria bacterium]